VRFDEETVWLTLDQMATLFDRDKSTVSRHIKNVFYDGELAELATVANFATVQTEGARQVERKIDYYNLDDEGPAWDTCERFIRNNHYPVRWLMADLS